MPSPPGCPGPVTVHPLAAASPTDDFYPSVSLWPPDVSSLGQGPSTLACTTVTSFRGGLSERKRLCSDKSIMSRGVALMGWPNTAPHQYHTGKPAPLSHFFSPFLLPLPTWCFQHPLCPHRSWEGEWEQVAGGRREGRGGERGASWQPAALTHAMGGTVTLQRKIDTGKSDFFFFSFFFSEA